MDSRHEYNAWEADSAHLGDNKVKWLLDTDDTHKTNLNDGFLSFAHDALGSKNFTETSEGYEDQAIASQSLNEHPHDNKLRTSIFIDNSDKDVNASKDFLVSMPGANEFINPITNGIQRMDNWATELKKQYNLLKSDLIIIEELSEKEGLLFKHINYKVKHVEDLPNTFSAKDRCVIRRYSDFVWLRDVLKIKYPLRTIPSLPPKNIGIQLSSKSFLKERRLGLARFINIVAKHPILSQEDLVLTFLTVPTELLSWRKHAVYDISDEFSDKKCSEQFKKIWDPYFLEQWNNLEQYINKSITVWNNMRILIEMNENNYQQISRNELIFKRCLGIFGKQDTNIYSVNEENTISEINASLHDIESHLENIFKIRSNETYEVVKGVIPKFNDYIEMLKSLKNLIHRYSILSRTNIQQLERRITINKEKLETLKDKLGIESDRLGSMIEHDTKSIIDQTNKSWLMKQCIFEEYSLFQQTQLMISDAFKEWAQVYSKYTASQSNEWDKLASLHYSTAH